MDFFETQFECPICHREDVVPPVGSETSPILIVGEFPGKEEIQKGIPMVGPMGRVLKQELFMLGMDLKQTRRTNLWLHLPNKNEGCLQYGTEQVIKEARGKKVILLLGSDVCKIFLDASVMDVAGLVMKSAYFTGSVICSPNPAIVFQKKGVGEVRLALQKFVKLVEGIK